MSNETELMSRIQQLMSENAKLSGKMSAISGYMDQVGIPKIPKINKRVKLMTILYQQIQIENKRISLLLNESGEDE